MFKLINNKLTAKYNNKYYYKFVEDDDILSKINDYDNIEETGTSLIITKGDFIIELLYDINTKELLLLDQIDELKLENKTLREDIDKIKKHFGLDKKIINSEKQKLLLIFKCFSNNPEICEKLYYYGLDDELFLNKYIEHIIYKYKDKPDIIDDRIENIKKKYFDILHIQSYNIIGNYYKCKSNLKMAKIYYEKACVKGNPEDIYSLGIEYEKLNNYDEMEKCYLLCIEYNYKNALYNLLKYYKKINDHDKIIKISYKYYHLIDVNTTQFIDISMIDMILNLNIND